MSIKRKKIEKYHEIECMDCYQIGLKDGMESNGYAEAKIKDEKPLKPIKGEEFIKNVNLIKDWFDFEELEVSDFVIGRFASRLQSQLSIQREEIVGEIEKYKHDFINNDDYDLSVPDALNDILNLLGDNTK